MSLSWSERFYNAFFEEQRYLVYWDGLKVTLIISFFAILIGVLIGTLVSIAKVSMERKKHKRFDQKLLLAICNGYITLIRSTPVVVQLMIIYNLIFVSRNTNEVFVGAVCFGINSGAYVAEIIRAGIMSIDRGQTEAGRSLGLTSAQTMKLIILPQAIKNILPALGNEFIVLIKETSVVSFIAVTDLFQGAKYIGSRTYDMLPPMLIVAVMYLIIVLGLSKLLRVFEGRLAKGDHR